MKITYRRVNHTYQSYLSSWVGYIWKIKHYKSGKVMGGVIIKYQNIVLDHVLTGQLKHFSKPLKNYKIEL